MRFIDLNINGKSFEKDIILAKEAEKLGYSHINFTYPIKKYETAEEYLNQLQEEIQEYSTRKEPLTITQSIHIKSNNSDEMRKTVRKQKKKEKILSVFGGDLKINRAACENLHVDILSRPYFHRRDSGMNHVLCKEAVRNNVAIELCLADIINSYLFYRARTIFQFKEIIKFYRKFKFPLIITSGAQDFYTMRIPQDIIAILKTIGLTNIEIKKITHEYPTEILNYNKEKKNMIVVGVKKIEDPVIK